MFCYARLNKFMIHEQHSCAKSWVGLKLALSELHGRISNVVVIISFGIRMERTYTVVRHVRARASMTPRPPSLDFRSANWPVSRSLLKPPQELFKLARNMQRELVLILNVNTIIMRSSLLQGVLTRFITGNGSKLSNATTPSLLLLNFFPFPTLNPVQSPCR